MSPKKQAAITIPAPDIRMMQVEVVGKPPGLLINRLSNKTKRIMEEKREGKVVKKRIPTDEEEFNDARYLVNGKDHIKAIAFKLAMIDVAKRTDMIGVTGTLVKQSVFILGNLIPIKGKPVLDKQDGRTVTGRPKPCIRPLFKKWSVVLDIEYQADAITPEMVVNLLEHAGFSAGVGDNRPTSPKKSGPHGRFTVAKQKARRRSKVA